MTENQAREEICRVGRSLFGRGCVHASAGNISVRLDDGFLITPTDACLGFLDPARLAKLDAGMSQLSGDAASKAIALHARICDAAARFDWETSCVIHTHSRHCVALTLQAHEADLVPALTPYFVMKVGRVPVIPYHRPGAPNGAEAVKKVLQEYGARGTPLRAVMLARLGPNVWHDTPAAAMAVLEEREETARLWSLAAGRADPLTACQIDELHCVFGARR